MRRRIVERVGANRDTLGPQQRFLADIVGSPSGDVLSLLASPARQAAVLMPIIEHPDGLRMLFTARAGHLLHHPGQVAFPGGRIEPDDGGAAAAALREAREEVGLLPSEVELVGDLGAHLTGTGFVVTPFVAFVSHGFVPDPDPAEVAAVFDVPLEFLLDPANCGAHYRDRFGSRFRSYEYRWQGWRIWGATAAMIVTLRELIH